jgi:hypothetical protein
MNNIFVGKHEERKTASEDLGVDRRVMRKWILEK